MRTCFLQRGRRQSTGRRISRFATVFTRALAGFAMIALGGSAYSQSPPEINNSVRFMPTVDGMAIAWDDPPGSYNIYRGSNGVGSPWVYNQACLDHDLGASSLVDQINPPPHRLFYYLVSRVSTPLESPIGRNSQGVETPNAYACPTPPPDADADGMPDVLDNCPSISNPNQLDTNLDGTGDACQCLNVQCPPFDECHLEGTCDPQTGLCSIRNNSDGEVCDDENACTQADTCNDGICSGSAVAPCSVCPPGFTEVGALCQKIYDISAFLLDNLVASCDGTGANRYNNCGSRIYGFHWTDLGGSLPAVTRVDVQLESGLNCGGTSSSVTLNGVPVGNFSPIGACQCVPAHGTISLPSVPVGTYVRGGENTISITPSGTCEGLSRAANLGNNYARISVTYSTDSSGCQVGACDPATGACNFSNLPDGTLCSDINACTTGDTCQGGRCTPASTTVCADQCHTCDPATGTCSLPTVCTALDQCHDVGSCDPSTGTCSNPQKANSASCSDGNACTTGDTCQAGVCTPGTPTVCTAFDQCHVAGTCDPAFGFCSNPNAVDGTSCNDANACTQPDTCQAGTCRGSNPVVCTASDSCHIAGTCNSGTGVCSNPAKPDGATCDDGNPSTPTDICLGLQCVRCVPNGGASPRYVDNGTTVTDLRTCFVWEKKTGTDPGPGVNCSLVPCPDPHSVNNAYPWSSSGQAADGAAFTDFLAKLNAGTGFEGRNDWRLPTSAGCCGAPTGQPAELESIVQTVPLGPTINPIFGPTYDGCYWTASTWPIGSNGASFAFLICFANGSPSTDLKIYGDRVRAVRGGP